MPLAQRSAEVVWNGNLTQGSGTVTAATSGAFTDLPVTFASRTENPDGKTSPEELLASAHAICYAMVIANTLNRAGTPPQQLTVNAVCSLDRVDGGLKITAMDLNLRGKVPGIDQATFERTAQEGEKACPVSNALRGNVEVRVNATLEQ